MEDRFKFRAKTIDGMKFIEGSLGNPIVDCQNYRIIYEDFEGHYCEESVITKTIGQCTGLKDKNGKLIFEGDIVKVCGTEELGITEIDIKENCIVKWDKKSAFYFCDVINKRGIKLTEHGYYDFDYLPLFQNESDEEMFDFEILGNIYENKELLGEE